MILDNFVGNCQKLLVTVGNCQELSGTVGNCRELSGTVRIFLKLMLSLGD